MVKKKIHIAKILRTLESQRCSISQKVCRFVPKTGGAPGCIHRPVEIFVITVTNVSLAGEPRRAPQVDRIEEIDPLYSKHEDPKTWFGMRVCTFPFTCVRK